MSAATSDQFPQHFALFERPSGDFRLGGTGDVRGPKMWTAAFSLGDGSTFEQVLEPEKVKQPQNLTSKSVPPASSVKYGILLVISTYNPINRMYTPIYKQL